MDGFGAGLHLEKNALVIADEAHGALQRLREDVLNPALNSIVVEPLNAVVSSVNTISEQLNGAKLLPHKDDFYTGEPEFLSSKWFVQSASGGLALLIPYTLAGKAAGGLVGKIGSRLNFGEQATRFLENEATLQILGAATYDGLRETRPGETHTGNALGGVTAFGTFAIGNALSKDLPLAGMIGMRTLAGAIGGTAQHAVSAYWSGSKLPSVEEMRKATINGVVMSLVLPEGQRMFATIAHHGNESLGLGVPMDRFFEIRPGQTRAVQTAPHVVEELPTVEHTGTTYDFFVKLDSLEKVGQDRGKEEMMRDLFLRGQNGGMDLGSTWGQKARSLADIVTAKIPRISSSVQDGRAPWVLTAPPAWT